MRETGMSKIGIATTISGEFGTPDKLGNARTFSEKLGESKIQRNSCD